MKVFLDTNVWLSATVFAGLCEDIVVQCADRAWLVSSHLVRKEAHEVLRRKFAQQLQAGDLFDAIWNGVALIDDQTEPANDNDARLIRAAVAAKVNVFVTGDKRVLSWMQKPPKGVQLGNLRIASPRDAWTLLFGGQCMQVDPAGIGNPTA